VSCVLSGQLGQAGVEGFELVGTAWVWKVQPAGDVDRADALALPGGDQQAGNGEHLGVGDHVSVQGAGSRCGQLLVPLVPAAGERRVPVGFQPLGDDGPGLLVSSGDLGVGDVAGVLVVMTSRGCRRWPA
jgi:hypothetical protein